MKTGIYKRTKKRGGWKLSEETRKRMSKAKQNISEKTRKKLSKALKGRKCSEAARKKMSKAQQNMSEETKRKIGQARIGMKMTEETRKKISEAQIGKKLSEEHKKKLSEARKGKKLSLETKKKMSEARKGENNPNWGGKYHTEEWKKKASKGIKKYYDRIGRKTRRKSYHLIDKKYKDWRTAVYKRDSWTCQVCEKVGVYLEAHHIKSWAKYPELRFAIDNGITLCKECHLKFHRKYGYKNTKEQLKKNMDFEKKLRKEKTKTKTCRICKGKIKRGQSWLAVAVGKDEEGFLKIDDYHLSCYK